MTKFSAITWEDPESKTLHITLGSLLLALYSTLGCFVLLVTAALWYEAYIELGLPTTYQLTFRDAFLWSLGSIVGFILICITTNLVEQSSSISETNKPSLAAILNAVVTITVHLTIYLAAVGMLAWYGFTMLFTLANGGIVGISTYFHIAIPMWKKPKSVDPLSELEVLKLEHDWVWRAINIISWATLIVSGSAWLVVFSQVSLPAIPVEKRLEPAFMKILGGVAFQAAYAFAGVFLGIIVKLWTYSAHIRKKVSELKLPRKS